MEVLALYSHPVRRQFKHLISHNILLASLYSRLNDYETITHIVVVGHSNCGDLSS